MIEIRISRQLFNKVTADLTRPHPFAFERVGFVHGKLGSVDNGNKLILLNRYRPIPDVQYLYNPKCGASISGDAIRETMQSLRDRCDKRECAFHIHLHAHRGVPMLSTTDESGIPPLIPSFARASRDGAHGLIILSKDHGRCLVWLPGSENAVTASRIAVIGSPLSIFEVEDE